MRGDGATEMEPKEKKGRAVEARREERHRGTVRNDARQRRGKPATSQPDCKTLYKTRRTRVTRDDWFVRSSVRSLSAATFLSSAFGDALLPVLVYKIRAVTEILRKRNSRE